MKWSFAIVSVIVLGIFSLFILFLFDEITVKNEDDYYLLKEVTEAAMYDSVDVAYFRDTGNIKIVEEKFMENFIRRFSESCDKDDYEIVFSDILEEPAKVTVQVSVETNTYNIYSSPTSTTVVNKISGIFNS